MPPTARAPKRSSVTYFVGAGVGAAFGVPNTQELLDAVHRLGEETHTWAASKNLGKRLEEAYRYFYPLEKGTDAGFRPNVVDFFSVLKTFSEISHGLPGKLEGTAELLADLRRAVANVLINALRAVDDALGVEQPELHEILTPGNLVITTNWDLLLERYAQKHRIPVRHTLKKPESEVTLVKLHGSVDWCQAEKASKPLRVDEYGTTEERLFGPRPYEIKPTTDHKVLRIRALENWTKAWSRVKSRAQEPMMITMAMGKAADLGDLLPKWRDAYGAISRAKELHVVGYSLPMDDIEIRTLLIAGLERGAESATVTVRNPSPEVHDRFRAMVARTFHSEYVPLTAKRSE